MSLEVLSVCSNSGQENTYRNSRPTEKKKYVLSLPPSTYIPSFLLTNLYSSSRISLSRVKEASELEDAQKPKYVAPTFQTKLVGQNMDHFGP